MQRTQPMEQLISLTRGITANIRQRPGAEATLDDLGTMEQVQLVLFRGACLFGLFSGTLANCSCSLRFSKPIININSCSSVTAGSLARTPTGLVRKKLCGGAFFACVGPLEDGRRILLSDACRWLALPASANDIHRDRGYSPPCISLPSLFVLYWLLAYSYYKFGCGTQCLRIICSHFVLSNPLSCLGLYSCS